MMALWIIKQKLIAVFANGKNHINGIEILDYLTKFKSIKRDNFILRLKWCKLIRENHKIYRLVLSSLNGSKFYDLVEILDLWHKICKFKEVL